MDAQAEFPDAALAVLAYLEDDSEAGADFALGEITITPARGRPGQVTVELIDLRERRAAQQQLELLAASPVKVAQPSLRHRGPRRGHVGARRRPGTRRVASSASSRGDPHLDDPEQEPLNQRRSHPRHDKGGGQ